MTKISHLTNPESFQKKSAWQVVGGLWPHKVKPDTFIGEIGLAVAGPNNTRVQVFDSITLVPGDVIMIRPNTSTTPKAPKYRIVVLEKDSPKEA